MNETLAQTSNNLVFAAIIVFALALFAFAMSFAAGRVAAVPAVAPSRVPAGDATVAAGSVAAGTTLTPVRAPAGPGSTDGRVPGWRRAGNIGMSLTWLGTGLLFLAVLCRGLAAGRAPWGNMYEFSITSALVISVVFLGVSLRRDVRWLGVLVILPVLLTLGLAVTVLYTGVGALVPNLNSPWLVIHVFAAITCGASFAVGAAVTVLYLMANRVETRVAAGQTPGRLGFVAARVPPSERLDLLAYRIHAFMFPLWTFAVIAGAIWAENAWGRYWGWDPKETWAFITWVVYACYLHARATVGWRGRRAAYIALAGFACFVINYYGVNLFVSGLHSYSGV